jgi:hypothetical protein
MTMIRSIAKLASENAVPGDWDFAVNVEKAASNDGHRLGMKRMTHRPNQQAGIPVTE